MITATILSTHNITLFANNEQITIPNDHPDAERIVELLRQDRAQEAFALATKYRSKLKQIASVAFKNTTVSVEHGNVLVNGKIVEGTLVDRILEFSKRNIPRAALMTLLARVQRNPDPRAREDLFAWIEKNNMPVTADGCFIAFKIVKENYWDIYTGRTFKHTVGSVIEMPRDEVDDNPNQTCSRGAHFCGEGYIPHYGSSSDSRIVTLKIAPEDVVAFPTDYGLAKGRAFRYEVIGELNRNKVADYLGSINRSYAGAESDFEEDEVTGY
jgi:hypothetical protein